MPIEIHDDEDNKHWKPIPMENEVRRLTTKQIAELLERESPSEWEPWQNFNFPVNTLK